MQIYLMPCEVVHNVMVNGIYITSLFVLVMFDFQRAIRVAALLVWIGLCAVDDINFDLFFTNVDEYVTISKSC